MTEPGQPIEFSKVQVGDTIHVRRVENAGTENEIVSTIQGVVSDVSESGSIGFRGSLSWYSARDVGTITLLHRPPTRRRITFDELKDWRVVPIGTRIEFETATGESVEMAIIGRYQFTDDWVLYPASGRNCRLSDIKEDTLFVIEEEAKP